MRKTAFVQIPQEEGNRDSGKMFLLTEMPALKAEKWATRLLLAMTHSGIDIPEDIANSGMAGVAAMGFKMIGNINFFEAEALLDEMLTCVRIVPDPSRIEVTRPLNMPGGNGDDIEEIATLITLRKGVFDLHADFFMKELRLRLGDRSSTAPAVLSPT